MYLTGWTALLAVLGAIPAALTQSRDVAWWWLARTRPGLTLRAEELLG